MERCSAGGRRTEWQDESHPAGNERQYTFQCQQRSQLEFHLRRHLIDELLGLLVEGKVKSYPLRVVSEHLYRLRYLPTTAQRHQNLQTQPLALSLKENVS